MPDPKPNEELNINLHQESDEHQESESRVIEYFQKEDNSNKLNFNETLSIIYQLKLIDKELAEIEEEKGDLPGKISDLTSQISDFETKRTDYETQLTELNSEKINLFEEDKNSEAKIFKYDEEKYKVKNNKE